MTTNPTRGRLPVPRRDRRPMLAALAILLILLGALGSALVAFRSGDRVSVLVAASDIEFGQVIQPNDLTEVRAASDTEGLIEARFKNRFVGTRSTTVLPEGALLHAKMFTTTNAVPDGGELVGIVLDPTRRTSSLPQPGQVVRLYYVSGAATQSGSAAGNAPGDVVVPAARVVATGAGSGSDTRSITVLVREQSAGVLADFASSGNISVTVLPDDTTPPVDMVTG